MSKWTWQHYPDCPSFSDGPCTCRGEPVEVPDAPLPVIEDVVITEEVIVEEPAPVIEEEVIETPPSGNNDTISGGNSDE